MSPERQQIACHPLSADARSPLHLRRIFRVRIVVPQLLIAEGVVPWRPGGRSRWPARSRVRRGSGPSPGLTAPGARMARSDTAVPLLAGSSGGIAVAPAGLAPGRKPVQKSAGPAVFRAEDRQSRGEKKNALENGQEKTDDAQDDQGPARGEPEDSPGDSLPFLPQHRLSLPRRGDAYPLRGGSNPRVASLLKFPW